MWTISYVARPRINMLAARAIPYSHFFLKMAPANRAAKPSTARASIIFPSPTISPLAVKPDRDSLSKIGSTFQFTIEPAMVNIMPRRIPSNDITTAPMGVFLEGGFMLNLSRTSVFSLRPSRVISNCWEPDTSDKRDHPNLSFIATNNWPVTRDCYNFYHSHPELSSSSRS